MAQRVLLVTAMFGENKCSAVVTRQLNVTVQIVGTRRIALAALRSREYSVLVLDRCMLDSDPAGLELLWQEAGCAIPVEVNLAISGWPRVLREVELALQRRQHEQILAQQSALQFIEGALSTTITGLVLTIQLAMQEPALSPTVVDRLRQAALLAIELSSLIRRAERQ